MEFRHANEKSTAAKSALLPDPGRWLLTEGCQEVAPDKCRLRCRMFFRIGLSHTPAESFVFKGLIDERCR
ncbi:hypothetical protein OHAE_1812 [Ochrobactrum soli]|uniref:Uncharacterized protein n=1 Tax=Ochrobactrum soli TaxID=2448455 RepID=A0A2P9HP64_9HYPH|nr:hypothetical protein OHAE_1812 [[Ochrobactrum] soli]